MSWPQMDISVKCCSKREKMEIALKPIWIMYMNISCNTGSKKILSMEVSTFGFVHKKMLYEA